MGLINEAKTNLPVRSVVRDIINVVKNGGSDEFYLPEDISEEFRTDYEFPQLPFSFDVVLDLTINDQTKYYLDASLLGDDTIGIKLNLNSQDLPQKLYTLLGDLNDIIAHEIEHIYQNYGFREEKLEDYPEYEQTTGKDYYKHPIEIPAQIAGFKRQSKITGKPVETLMKDYFEKIKDEYNLSDEDVKDIISFLISKI